MPSKPEPVPVSHVEWQEQVRQLATYLGWSMLTVRRSIGKGRKWTTTTSIIGWPDCFLFHPTRGFVAFELKVGKDTPTDEQADVLRRLQAAGARVLVAYPHDLELVKSMLSSEP